MIQVDQKQPETGTAGNVGEATKPLTGLDRCDSCGAQAYVRATFAGSELLFCAHHARAHESKLKPIADTWQDETHKLQ